MKKRKKSTRISPPKDNYHKVDEEIIRTPFHISFPVHLRHKDGKIYKDCYFKDDFDCEKYIKRYKLKSKDYTISETDSRE